MHLRLFLIFYLKNLALSLINIPADIIADGVRFLRRFAIRFIAAGTSANAYAKRAA